MQHRVQKLQKEVFHETALALREAEGSHKAPAPFPGLSRLARLVSCEAGAVLAAAQTRTWRLSVCSAGCCALDALDVVL